MIVWGGATGFPGNSLNTRGRYNPATDSWMGLTTAGAPDARYYQTAVWRGHRTSIHKCLIFNAYSV